MCWGVGGGEERCGKCGEMLGRCGKVCCGVGKINGNEQKSVGGMGKMWKSVLGVGEVWGEVWEGVHESVWERCGKVCWGVRKVRGETGGGCGQVLGRGVGKCVGMWER